MAALPWDFTWCNFKWLTFAFRFLDWATFLKILKIIYYSSILHGRPRPPCQNNKSFQPILTAVHKASQKQIGPITTQEHRLWLVREIILSNITFFSFFSVIDLKKLICLFAWTVDCIGVNILKVSWCLVYILVLLWSAFQNGCSSLVFYVIQFQMGYIRISFHRLGYFSQNFEDHLLLFNIV